MRKQRGLRRWRHTLNVFWQVGGSATIGAGSAFKGTIVALTSIAVGTALGVAVAYNVISDSRRTPSWANMAFTVPWLTLAVIFIAVYAVALATTLLPSIRAARVYPAEALRYQ